MNTVRIGHEYVLIRNTTWGGRAGNRYRVLSFALHVHTRQELVVYEGMTGVDAGRWFVCTPADFTLSFAELERAPATEPDKVPTTETPAGEFYKEVGYGL